jgi:hypothetical protein
MRQHAVTAVGISVEFLHTRDDSCSNRVQVDVPDQFQEIRLLLAEDGLVSVLKQRSMALISPVEAHHITGEQSSHQIGDALGTGSKEEVYMIGKQRPRKTRRPSGWNKLLKPRKQVLAVAVRPEYLTLSIPLNVSYFSFNQ